MLLVDFSGIVYPVVSVAWSNTKKAYIDNDFTNPYTWDDEGTFEDRYALQLKSRILNILLKLKSTYTVPRERIIIAIDSKYNWRKRVFKYYKAMRKHKRKESDIDWNMTFEIINKFLEDLKENFYFTVIKWEMQLEDGMVGCEADDIIAVLARYHGKKVTVISDDIDIYQLHDLKDFSQYNYKNVKKGIEHVYLSLKIDTYISPKKFLLVKSLNGDRKDDVPNFRNEDNVWVDRKVHKNLGSKTSLKIIDGDPEIVVKYGNLNDIKKTPGYIRNNTILDLNNIPDYIQKGILDMYLSYKHTGSEHKITEYLYEHVSTGNKYLINNANKFVISGIDTNTSRRQLPFGFKT